MKILLRLPMTKEEKKAKGKEEEEVPEGFMFLDPLGGRYVEAWQIYLSRKRNIKMVIENGRG